MISRRESANRRKRLQIGIAIVLVLIVGFFIYKAVKYTSVVVGLVNNKDINSPEKKVNILLLGVGGGTHDGPDLTDTIIFASVDPQIQKTTLVSIPRDLWIPDLHAKINAAYTFGEEAKQSGGLSRSKAVIGKVVGQPIDYAIKIDFDGFVKAVDMEGGLDIDVTRTFDDYAYPVSGKEDDTCGLSEDQVASASAQIASGSASEVDSFPCRYKHLHFDKGLQHMDGTTALEYVRSRHALGPEGSDFARSKRQQKVIAAFKNKLFSLGTLLNPVKVIGLIDTIKGSIDTDIQQSEFADFVKLAKKMQHAKIESVSIDEGDSINGRYGLLMEPAVSADYGGQWVLAPRAGNGDYSEIHEYVTCMLQKANCMVGAHSIETPTPTLNPSLSVSRE